MCSCSIIKLKIYLQSFSPQPILFNTISYYLPALVMALTGALIVMICNVQGTRFSHLKFHAD